jgi:hypothetical protein
VGGDATVPRCGGDGVSAASFDPLGALRTFMDHGVRFVLIGGYAGTVRGSALITGDIDVCYARDVENLQRLAAALVEMRARLRGPGVPDGLPFVLDAPNLRNGDSFTFETDVGNVDVLGTPAGTQGFEDLDGSATSVDIDGLVIRVASLDDLMRMKRAAGRPKDLIQLEHLGALREEIEAFRATGEDPQQGV